MLKRHRKWWKIAGIVILVAAGGILLWWQRGTDAVTVQTESGGESVSGAGLREIVSPESEAEPKNPRDTADESPDEGSFAGRTVAVHVSGWVASPDIVVYLPEGARVTDAIQAAGGALSEAGLWKLNLARAVRDGERIYVPGAEEEWEESYSAEAEDSSAGSPKIYEESRGNGLTDLNKADKILLEALPGIGPVLAQRIIAYRSENGPFESIYELKSVKGIGEALFREIAGLITVGESTG